MRKNQLRLLLVAVILLSFCRTACAVDPSDAALPAAASEPRLAHLQVPLPVPAGATEPPAIVSFAWGHIDSRMMPVKFAAWPDGALIWMYEDVPPRYRRAKLEPERIEEVLRELEADATLENAAFCPPQSYSVNALERCISIRWGDTDLVIRRRAVTGTQPADQCAERAEAAFEEITSRFLALVPTAEGEFEPVSPGFRLLFPGPHGDYHLDPNAARGEPIARELAARVNVPVIEGESERPFATVYRKLQATQANIIVAFYSDGRVVRGPHEIEVGPPYFEGRIDPSEVERLRRVLEDEVARMDFADLCEPLDSGIDNTIALDLGVERVQLSSAHEIMERGNRNIYTIEGHDLRGDREGDEWLSTQPICYQAFRGHWSMLKTTLMQAMPPMGECKRLEVAPKFSLIDVGSAQATTVPLPIPGPSPTPTP